MLGESPLAPLAVPEILSVRRHPLILERVLLILPLLPLPLLPLSLSIQAHALRSSSLVQESVRSLRVTAEGRSRERKERQQPMRYGAAATSYVMLEPIRATVIQMMPQGLNLVLLAAVLLQHVRHIPEPFAGTPD